MLTEDLTEDACNAAELAERAHAERASIVSVPLLAGSAAARDTSRDDDVVRSRDPLPARSRALIARSSIWATIAGFVPFVLVLWDFRFDPFRAATNQKFASNFYDIQARGLIHGRLSAPLYSFGIEGFVIDGRTYMYFPPFPALLRIPVLLVTDRLDGRLTAPSMLLGWILLAAATAALMWHVRLLMRGACAVGRLEAAMYAVLMTTILGGSVVVFDASLPWVYHEVYVWATAFTIATMAALAAIAWRPSTGRAVIATVCAFGAILTRTTSGWAMCVTVVTFGLAIALRDRRLRRVATVLVVGGAAALVAGAAVNWMKFRHPYMFPLEHQEWTKTNSRRRLALRMNGGTITGRQFFLTSLVNYFRPDGIRFVPYFPFVTLPAEPARPYGGAFLDQWYRTGSVTAFMPLLLVSTLWGFATAFRRRASEAVRALRIPLLGALAITGGVMFYGYVAHRYTSEFLPVLVIGSTIGIVDLARRASTSRRSVRRAALTGMVTVAAFSMITNAAAGIAAARLTFRGDALEQFVDAQFRTARLTGALDDLVARSDTLPADGPADRLQILGDCDALYIATGDAYEPWIAVQSREYHVRIKSNPEAYHYGALRLIDIDGLHQRSISVEGDGTGRIRLRIGEGYVFYPTDWIPVSPGKTVTVAVRLDTTINRYLISLAGEEVGYVAASETDGNSQVIPAVLSFALPSELDQAIVGYTLTAEQGSRLDVCDRLADATAPGD